MNKIPTGLPGELNLMLLLDDTNLKQECDKIVQNGTMDCMKNRGGGGGGGHLNVT